MKEIMAIIRPTALSETKKKLVEAGYPAYTCQRAQGRGKKPAEYLLSDGSKTRTTLVAKRVVIVVVPDAAEKKVIKAIMDVNSTGTMGDGKIFVTDIEKSYHVRKRQVDEEDTL